MRKSFIPLAFAVVGVRGGSWPYTRTFTNRTTPADERNDIIADHFVEFLKDSITKPHGAPLADAFQRQRIPHHVRTLDQLEAHLAHHTTGGADLPKTVWDDLPANLTLSASHEAELLFNFLKFELEPSCIDKKLKFWYRADDGHCNWLRKGQSFFGQTGQPRSRDWGQTTYADGKSKPRDGPNPRELSNAFFKRKERIHYQHTPLMLGLVEFLMHDVTYSKDSTTEWIDVPIPKGDPDYDPKGYGNASFKVWRTEPVPGTVPREHANEATAWLDVSALYGSTPQIVQALRSKVNGKLKAQRGKDGFEYLPFNVDGLPVRTRPGVDPHDLFLGGDVRTNEDWIMLSVHTLLLREHNRLCDLVVAQHPDWDDERVYQTVKLVVGAKIALIGNSYQMAYWAADMPWPRDDGFPLYRAMYGESVLEISPLHAYPWPMVTRNDRPMVTSAEMAIVYRFHEFIINSFPIKDEHNATVETKRLFNTAFDAKGYVETGADPILRGMLATDIPNFKSGVDEDFRSAGKYRGNPFDIVTWSIVHEREQGLPTFNQYFTNGYQLQTPTPAVVVKNRKRFEDFSSDPKIVAELKRLYRHPDDVDFVVGVQLEETLFPGTTMPVSALIPSLFSLFGVGNSDRFSPGFAVMRCFLVDKPWNCRPSNAFEELIWEARPSKDFPNKRWFSDFWMKELDFQAHGVNLLWRLITENSGAKCIQKNPLFPFDPDTNPILCDLEPAKTSWTTIIATIVAVLVGASVVFSCSGVLFGRCLHRKGPPVNWGVPLLGVGAQLQKDPTTFLRSQVAKFGGKTFGLRMIWSTVYYVAMNAADIEVMKLDELRASLQAITADSQLGAIVGRHNFKSALHATVIRRKLDVAATETVPNFSPVIAQAVNKWLAENPLKDTDDISDQILRLMACVMSRLCMGPDGYDSPELIDAYVGLNADSSAVLQYSNILPRWIGRIFSSFEVSKHYKTVKKYVLPVIKQRRKEQAGPTVNSQATDILGFFLDVSDNDNDVAELVGGIVIGGLINIATAATNGIYNVAEVPGLQDKIRVTAPPGEFVATSTSSGPWDSIRSITLETLRLAACIFGPVRKIITKDFKLGSNPKQILAKNSGLAASPYLMHYNEDYYPNNAAFEPQRFDHNHGDALIGTVKYLTFGLPGHTCPGRFLAIEATSIALNALVSKYKFSTPPPQQGDQLYEYVVGVVVMARRPKKLTIARRS